MICHSLCPSYHWKSLFLVPPAPACRLYLDAINQGYFQRAIGHFDTYGQSETQNLFKSTSCFVKTTIYSKYFMLNRASLGPKKLERLENQLRNRDGEKFIQ